MAGQTLQAEINIEVQQATAALNNLSNKVEQAANSSEKSFSDLSKSVKSSSDKIQKELSETAVSAVKMGDKLDKAVTRGAGGATNALTNLNRVVQDAPFGIIGIANNIDPLVQSFQKLKAESGSTGGALKALAGTLAGPTGILFAFSAVSSIATLLVQKYGSLGNAYNVLTGKVKDLTEEQKKYAEEQRKTAVSIEEQKISTEQLVKVARGDIGSKAEQIAALDKLNAAIPDYIGKLTLSNIKTAEGSAIINAYTDALIKQATAQGLVGRIAELSVNKITAETEARRKLIPLEEKRQQLARKVAALQKAEGKTLGGSSFAVNTSTGSGLAEQQLFEVEANINGILSALKSGNISIAQEIENLKKSLDENTVVIDTTKDLKVSDGGKIKKSAKKYSDEIELEFSKVKPTPEIVVLPSGIEIATGRLARLNTDIEQSINTTLAARPLEIKTRLNIQAVNLDSEIKRLESSVNQALSSFSSESLAQFGEIMGRGIADGAKGLSDAFKGLGNLFGNLLKQLGKILIEYAVAAAAAKLAIKSFNPVAAAAAGIALTALGSIVTSKLQATPFANGGIVTGPTLGLVGESGQPEVILPLSKINQFLDGGGGGGGQLTATITGDQLKFILDRTNRRQSRLF